MRNFKLTLIGLLALLIAGLIPQVGQTLTLKECEIAALSHSNRLASNAALAQQSKAELSEAEGMKFGSVDLTGTYGYTSETMKINFAIPGTPISRNISFGDGNNYDLAATAKLPLYAGGAVKARIESVRASQEAAVVQLTLDSIAVLYETRIAFYSVLGAEEKLKAAKIAADRIDRHIIELDSSLKFGVGTIEARWQAVGRQNQARVAVISAEGELRSARLQLGRVIGEPEKANSTEGSLDDQLIDPADRDTEHHNRPDVRALELRIEQSHYIETGAQAAWLPSLSAMAAYHYAKPGVSAAENEWMDYGVIGLNAAWTIIDWGARPARIQKAAAMTRSLESRLNELKTANSTMISMADSKWETARNALDPMHNQVEVETTRKSLIEQRLKLGAATESEYLDVLDDLSIAESNHALAKLKCRLAEAEFLFARAANPTQNQ